jgi:hypothetical protein
MPITQERMLAVLDEAQECAEQFRTFRRNIRSALDSGMREGALAAISVACQMAIVPAMTQCAIERAHFSRSQRANSRNAARMRRKRSSNSDLDAGVPNSDFTNLEQVNQEEERDDE